MPRVRISALELCGPPFSREMRALQIYSLLRERGIRFAAFPSPLGIARPPTPEMMEPPWRYWRDPETDDLIVEQGDDARG